MKTDKELGEDVNEKLKYDPSIDAKNVITSCVNGIVTLAGTVGSFFEKQAVEEAVKNVAGVRGVANELRVDFGSKPGLSDSEIANKVAQTLEWNVAIPHDKIKVSVEQGNVTLTGTVDWWYQRTAIDKAVRNLAGVRHVDNQVHISALVEPKDVKSKIMKEFHRNAQIDAEKIQIEVNGSEVTLKGKVRSWPEAEEAINGAWAAPGVTRVINQLIIE